MKKLKGWLVTDWWLKLISLFLAFVIWFAVVQANDPTDEKTFNNVKVTLLNEEIFDEMNKVYTVLDNTDVARVTVRAPKSVLSTLTASDIVAEADVSNMQDGTIAIDYSVNVNNVESVKGNHDTLKLEMEDKARKYISLAPFTSGEVAEGYLFNGVTLDQNMLEISGPKSSVEKVSYAAVEIDVTNAKSSLSANMEVILYDSSNQQISDSSIKKQVDYVHVDVEILETKSVIIYASKTGVPASGYEYTGNIYISPETVTIAGTSETLAGTNRILISDPIDISGVVSDVIKEVDLGNYLPDGIIFADSTFDGMAKVTVYVEQLSYKTFQISADSVQLYNVPDENSGNIALADEPVYVTLCGLQEELDKASNDSITVSVDVGTWMAENGIEKLSEAQYEVPVDITVSENLTCSGNSMAILTVSD